MPELKDRVHRDFLRRAAPPSVGGNLIRLPRQNITKEGGVTPSNASWLSQHEKSTNPNTKNLIRIPGKRKLDDQRTGQGLLTQQAKATTQLVENRQERITNLTILGVVAVDGDPCVQLFLVSSTDDTCALDLDRLILLEPRDRDTSPAFILSDFLSSTTIPTVHGGWFRIDWLTMNPVDTQTVAYVSTESQRVVEHRTTDSNVAHTCRRHLIVAHMILALLTEFSEYVGEENRFEEFTDEVTPHQQEGPPHVLATELGVNNKHRILFDEFEDDGEPPIQKGRVTDDKPANGLGPLNIRDIDTTDTINGIGIFATQTISNDVKMYTVFENTVEMTETKPKWVTHFYISYDHKHTTKTTIDRDISKYNTELNAHMIKKYHNNKRNHTHQTL